MWTVKVRLWVVCVCAFAGRAQGASLTYGTDQEGRDLCVLGKPSTNEYSCHDYNRTDYYYLIDFKNGGDFKVTCNEKRPVLEFSVLPRFGSDPLVVRNVILDNCPPPHNRSFKQALAAFNVNLLTELKLLKLPHVPQLTEDHFSGIEHLENLEITGSEPPNQPKPAAHFLTKLRSLLSLDLEYVLLQPDELDNLTTTLQQLTLKYTNVQRLPANVLELTKLRKLTLLEGQLEISLKSKLPQTLTELYLHLYKITDNLDEMLFNLPTSILTLEVWNETLPLMLASCGHLQKLQINESPALKALPELWLSKCSSLQNLTVKNAKTLKSLPENLLQGAKALTHITLMNNALETLPMKLFYGLDSLISLELQVNNLLTIPSDLFAQSSALRVLNLAYNMLTGDEVWKALEPLHALTHLNLGYNRQLGDACDENNGYSSINKSTDMTELILSETNITRICRDWREDMTLLKSLSLDDSNISVLQHEDLQYRRDSSVIDASVDLRGAPVVSVQFNESNYKLGTLASGATVYLDFEKFECNCRMYWTWLALNQTKNTNSLTGLSCVTNHGPIKLKKMSVNEMSCPTPDLCREAGLPHSCNCTARPELGETGASGRLLVRVRCEGAGLHHVPPLRVAAEWIRTTNVAKMGFVKKQLQHEDVVYDLLLANNNISVLRGAELQPRNFEPQPSNNPQLQHHFRELNLTNNSLEGVDEAAVILIARQRLRVHLANNSLVCDCSLAPLLRALSGRDQSAATCADGNALDAAPTEDCPLVSTAAWLAAALLALVVAATLGISCFANRERRLTLYVILYKLGLMRRTVERDDDCRFDAFISYSPEDEGVLSQIVKRLESNPTPYCLCLDYRDWVPGPFISNQIVASVRWSRRTVVLVSRHFLESEYARAEFRQAYALAMSEVTPRLVVVLLENPATLPLDARLRRYLRFNTYLRWGDPWFWHKLELALPIPRSRVHEKSPHPSPVSPRPPPVSPATLAAPVAPLVCCCWLSKTKRPLSYDRKLETINLNTIPSASKENPSPTDADLHASGASTNVSPEASGGFRGASNVASDFRPDDNGVCGAGVDPLASGRESGAP